MKNHVPRILIALSIFSLGLLLLPFVELPTEAFAWYRYAGAYHTPTPTPSATPSPSPTPTPTPVPSAALIYISANTNGNAGDVSFHEEDILVFDAASGVWEMYFEGSDVGLGDTNLDAFAFLPDDTILMSFSTPVVLPGIGLVDDSDIVRFLPTSLGDHTSGTFEMYLDGSAHGLSTAAEDIDAIGFAPNGRLLISTVGDFSLPGLFGKDEDLIMFNENNGRWRLYFDGSDVRLTRNSEDLWGAWVDKSSGKVYLTTAGVFGVGGGIHGDGADIFICTPLSIGNRTACSFSFYWDGAAHDLDEEIIDGLVVIPATP